MPTQVVSGRIRLGILALFVSTALVFVGNLVLGPLPDSPEDLRAFAEIASSPRYAIANFLLAVARLLAIFGYVALYACMAGGRAERWAFFAMVLSVAGVSGLFAATVGASGIEAVAAEQYLEGQRAVFEEWFYLFDWTSVFNLILTPGLVIGGILFGAAIWRSQFLPQGAAILWFASIPVEFVSYLPWLGADISGYISSLLFITACGWILWSVLRQPAATTREQLAPAQRLASRIRLGILALPVGAALLIVGTVIRGPIPGSPEGLRAYAEFVSAASTALSYFLFSIGQLLLIFGFVALYACMAHSRAERWAFFAMVLCVAGIASSFAYSLGTSGVEAVAGERYLQGQRAVLEAWYDLFDWTSIFSLILNPVLFSIGLILFGVAIWRSQTLPQGAAILWVASILFVNAAALTWWAEVVAFLSVGIAGGWIAGSVWRQPSARVGDVEARPRVQ